MQKEVRQNNKMTLVAKYHEEVTLLMQTPAIKTKTSRFTKIRILILNKVCVFNLTATKLLTTRFINFFD